MRRTCYWSAVVIARSSTWQPQMLVQITPTAWALSLISDIWMLGELIPRGMTRTETNDFMCCYPPHIYLSQDYAKCCGSSTGSHAWSRESQLVTLLRKVVQPLEGGTLLDGVDHCRRGLRFHRPAHGLLTLPLACACNVTSQPFALDPLPPRHGDEPGPWTSGQNKHISLSIYSSLIFCHNNEKILGNILKLDSATLSISSFNVICLGICVIVVK